jgi:hypothetical protein
MNDKLVAHKTTSAANHKFTAEHTIWQQMLIAADNSVSAANHKFIADNTNLVVNHKFPFRTQFGSE